MKNVNQLKWGAVLSYVFTGVSLAVGLVYTPFMIRSLGQNEFGLYSTVSSTVGMLGLLSLGFSSGYIRYYSKYRKDNKVDSIYRLNGLFFLIFLIIGAVSFICGLCLTAQLDVVFDEGLTAAEYGKAKVLMFILTVNMALSFPMGVFGNIISANERFVFLKLSGILTTVLSPLANVPLLIMGYKSVALVTVSLLLNLIRYAINIYYVLVVLRNRFCFSNFEKGIFTGLFSYSIFIAINIVVDQINWNIDKLLLARFIGTAEVAVYSVGFTLYSYYMNFSTTLKGLFTPRIHKIVNETQENLPRQRLELTELFTRVGRLQFLILGLLATGIIFFGRNFILKYWAGEEYKNSYYVALLLVIPATIDLIQNLGIEIQRAMNLHKYRSIVYAVMAALNLLLSIYLCQHYGAVGSAIGTAISFVIANGVVMNIFYHKKCNIDILYFWKQIARMFPGLVVPTLAGVILNSYAPIDGLFSFLTVTAVYSVVYILSMWLFAMNTYEKNLIRVPLNMLFRRKSTLQNRN